MLYSTEFVLKSEQIAQRRFRRGVSKLNVSVWHLEGCTGGGPRKRTATMPRASAAEIPRRGAGKPGDCTPPRESGVFSRPEPSGRYREQRHIALGLSALFLVRDLWFEFPNG